MPLLLITLGAAVPLWILRIESERWSWVRIKERAASCADVVAERGDVLQFGSRKEKGAAARAFNHLAEGLACLAFCPGGVKFCGLHFEATMSWGGSECDAAGAPKRTTLIDRPSDSSTWSKLDASGKKVRLSSRESAELEAEFRQKNK